MPDADQDQSDFLPVTATGPQAELGPYQMFMFGLGVYVLLALAARMNSRSLPPPGPRSTDTLKRGSWRRRQDRTETRREERAGQRRTGWPRRITLAFRVLREFFEPPAEVIDGAAVFEKVRQVMTGLGVGDGRENRREKLQRLRSHVVEGPHRFEKHERRRRQPARHHLPAASIHHDFLRLCRLDRPGRLDRKRMFQPIKRHISQPPACGRNQNERNTNSH